MKLVVGFLTYQELSAKYLTDFLPSLEAALGFLPPDDYRVLVFDNSPSDDQSNISILEKFNAGELITNDNRCASIPRVIFQHQTVGQNIGFSRAYNILIRSALSLQAEYFLIINPDTFIEPGAIQKLVAALDNNASLGSAAPKIRRWDFVHKIKTNFIDSAGLILKPGLKFFDLGQGEEDKGQFDKASIIGPSGAAGLFRLSALSEIGERGDREADWQYFDEHFFMYKEDCDLNYRLFSVGYFSCLVPEALVFHDRTAASSGQSLPSILLDRRKKSRQVRIWSFVNQHLLFVKHWKKQNFAVRMIIIYRILVMFIFSLILEQYLLKSYWSISRLSGGLTNIK